MTLQENGRTVTFTLGGMFFEYDKEKNQINIRKHGIPFTTAARIFFDYDRIELCDEHGADEIRYDTIGDISVGAMKEWDEQHIISGFRQSIGKINDILFVVYTERIRIDANGQQQDVIRLISARLATNFERGLYYGKQ